MNRDKQRLINRLMAEARGKRMDYQEPTETNRNLWEFEYTARNLATAAKGQRDFRLSRVEVWEGKKSEVMAKIKDSGLTVHEGVAAQLQGTYSTANAGYGGAQVMVDSTLQRDLNECVGKIQQHRNLANEYDSWLQVLDANPDARLKLKLGDWMFFFGKK